MSEGAMNDTSPPEDRADNCRRLVLALCDEYGAEMVAGVVFGQLPRGERLAEGSQP